MIAWIIAAVVLTWVVWVLITEPGTPPCARCGKPPSAIEHDWWDPGWPQMPVGKEPIDHWYESPKDHEQ